MEMQKTSGENAISVIGAIILFLGLIATFITFIVSCFGKSDISSDTVFFWQGIPLTFSILLGTLFTWSVCKILCEIAINTRCEEYGFSNWEKDFALQIALNNKEEAKAILYAQILASVEFSRYVVSESEESKNKILVSINNKFRIYLDELGIESFKLDTSSPIWHEFKTYAFQS